ncbi:hypothetical protein LGAA44_100012 [Leuconostoc gasicomitatum]|nr:hypothetical protein LGAA44_100012 [Leuconostoc gasicomitatum]
MNDNAMTVYNSNTKSIFLHANHDTDLLFWNINAKLFYVKFS